MASFFPALRTRATQTARIYSRQLTSSARLLQQGPEGAYNPNTAKETPNVSKTNEVAVDASGSRDAPLQESADVAEKARVMQAPNRAGVWSRSQNPREVAMTGPRFEQTIIEAQVGRLCTVTCGNMC